MFAFANKVLRNWVLGKKGKRLKKKKSKLALGVRKKEKKTIDLKKKN